MEKNKNTQKNRRRTRTVEIYKDGELIKTIDGVLKTFDWAFDELGDYIDDEGNFTDKEDFEWWKELANSLAYLEEKGTDIVGLEINELQDYTKITKEHRGADHFSHEALQNVYFDEGNGTYDLEFLVNGEKHYRQVQTSDHPEAATNENYFDDKKVVNRIIAALI